MTAAVLTPPQAREPRPEKVAAVQAIAEKLRGASAVILTEYRGLKVSEMRTLRLALRAAGAEYKVVKCTLARLAAADAGLDELVPQLSGPVAIAFVAEDIAGAAKAVSDFAKATPTLVVKGGVLEGRALSEADLKALADLPSREVLLSQVAGLFQAPAQSIASILNATLSQVVNLVDALERKQGEAA